MSVELWNKVVKAAGGVSDPENTLETTLMRNVITACGGNCDNLPDNLKSTLLVAMADAVASSAVEEETKTISPDFSGGDVVVTPTEGKLLSEVTVQKPTNLEPGNIAKDVDVGGIVGTLETGGGEVLSPSVWFRHVVVLQLHTISTAGSVTRTVTAEGMTNTTILDAYYRAMTSMSTGLVYYSTLNRVATIPTVDSSGNVSYAMSTYAQKATLALYFALSLIYNITGLYTKRNADGTCELIADSTCTNIPPWGKLCDANVIKADLSNATFTTLSDNAFVDTPISEIMLPPTLEIIGDSALDSDHLTKLDFSRHTFVPTVERYYHIASGTQILVPAALYDEWIAADQWSDISDRIVAV